MTFLDSLGVQFLAHFDLHETVDIESEFSCAMAARDGKKHVGQSIPPSGFYLVARKENPKLEFQQAILDGVRPVTLIAPVDKTGRIVGCWAQQEGLIYLDCKDQCIAMQKPEYATATDVPANMPGMNEARCNDAQVACLVSGLTFLAQQNQQGRQGGRWTWRGGLQR